MEHYYPIDGKQPQQQYRDHLSNFQTWTQREHAEQWILYSDNIGASLSLDETALSNGDLYTLLTNKAAKGRIRSFGCND
ncbi:hypothetical protein [Ancylomarina longa]|uniref:hypothetical protein n=1 Tax=Ancylomarina longa TaxID=2487017 RepID=UPI001F30CB06|nr:hypothetical protein [Ancylomarina longa]